MNLKTTLAAFWHDDQAQDLIEYTLLMAFVALASAALFLGAGGSSGADQHYRHDRQEGSSEKQHCGFLAKSAGSKLPTSS